MASEIRPGNRYRGGESKGGENLRIYAALKPRAVLDPGKQDIAFNVIH